MKATGEDALGPLTPKQVGDLLGTQKEREQAYDLMRRLTQQSIERELKTLSTKIRAWPKDTDPEGLVRAQELARAWRYCSETAADVRRYEEAGAQGQGTWAHLFHATSALQTAGAARSSRGFLRSFAEAWSAHALAQDLLPGVPLDRPSNRGRRSPYTRHIRAALERGVTSNAELKKAAGDLSIDPSTIRRLKREHAERQARLKALAALHSEPQPEDLAKDMGEYFRRLDGN